MSEGEKKLGEVAADAFMNWEEGDPWEVTAQAVAAEVKRRAGTADPLAAMSETKHTPGPWQFVRCEFNCDDKSNVLCPGSVISGEDVNDPNGRFIARIETTGTEIANARLIAAAPELLAALQDALVQMGRWKLSDDAHADRFGRMRDTGIDQAIAAARAAIAKAKGESQ